MKLGQKPNSEKKMVGAGAFGISMLMHVGLLLICGGIVIVQGVIPKSQFGEYLTENTFTDIPEPEALIEEPQLEDTLPSPLEATPEAALGNPDIAPLSNLLTVENTTSIPDFSLPTVNSVHDLNGKGAPGISNGSATGTGTGKGGFFGFKGSDPDALVGHLYDIKLEADGKTGNPSAKNDYFATLNQFCRNWDTSILKKYFQVPDTLSSYQFFIPLVSASEAPKAFNAEREVKPIYWIAHYKGKVTAPVSGQIRFAGQGDNILVVRFNNEVVIDASLEGALDVNRSLPRDPIGKAADPHGRPMVAGKWFNITKGLTYPMEVLLGESGGSFSCYLLVQEKDSEYKRQSDGINPRLPVFQAKSTKLPSFKEGINAPEVAKDALVFSKP